MALGEAESTLQTLMGSVCPRCRYQVDAVVGGKLVRCPRHPSTVLVSHQALAEGDGDPFLGAVVAGRFAVLELLGAGSMGTVYRARQEAMGRDVALKIVRAERLMDSQAKTRFQREAHAMSMLESPYTVTVFDFGEIHAGLDEPRALDGSLYLAMELLDGESIGDRIRRLGRLEVAEALIILRHALASLAEAHEKGIIHRDLKPDNLIVVRTNAGELKAKVLDFGIAKLLTTDGRVDVLETQAGTVFGTPRYMSPEQAQGTTLDARSDLYALGVILYHMLVGSPPFADQDAVVVMAHHIKSVPKRPTEVALGLRLPVGLEELLMRVLHKDPARRPQSAFLFAAELDQISLGASERSGTMSVVAHLSARPQRERRLMLAGMAAVAIGGLLVAGYGMQRFFAAERPSSVGPSAARTVASAPMFAGSPSDVAPEDSSAAALPLPEPTASASAAPAMSVSVPHFVPGKAPLPSVVKKRTYTKIDR